LAKMEKQKKEANEVFSQGNYQEAIDKFGECLELDPLNVQYNSAILFNRAVAYSKLSKPNEAIEELNAAIAINEDYTKAYIKRSELNLAKEEYEEAVRDLEKAYSID